MAADKNLPFRQVHLDFHTSECIKGIGERFSKENFINALKAGCVNSITLFSKCHHGWSYHPTKVNEMHPNLHFDLLKAQMEACREAGIRVQVYISAGVDEKEAVRHKDWVFKERKDSAVEFKEPWFHLLCFNTPYLDLLCLQIKEALENYRPDGLFLDISNIEPCRCGKCLSDMASEGLDPDKESDFYAFQEKVYKNYAKRVKETAESVIPGIPIFHNAGHILRGRRDLIELSSHLELESLPTGQWGYDHFPISASYVKTLGKQFLGMTGKFHTIWGEFGGFKHKNALIYETALSLSFGGKCSIGDQLHPNGEMDENTYRLIGAAYGEVEKVEQYCKDITPVADIGLLSSESSYSNVYSYNNAQGIPDNGAAKILFEGNFLFDIIDGFSDFGKYRVIILPDMYKLNTDTEKKLVKFVCSGGKILASGTSCLNGKNGFAVDLGIKYLGQCGFTPSYMKPCYYIKDSGDSPLIMYSQAHKIENINAQVIVERQMPYAKREGRVFSSHQHFPSSLVSDGPGITINGNGAYIGWNIFEDYYKTGELHMKNVVLDILDRITGKKTLSCNMPTQGIVTLNRQPEKNRYVLHALFAQLIKRGNIQVIEDNIPLFNINFTLNIPEKAKRIYKAPQNEAIPFTSQNGAVSFTLDRIDIKQLIVIEY